MLIAIIMQEMINKVCILVSFSCAVRNCLTHCSHNSSNFGRIIAACLFGDVLDWSVLCIVSQLFFDYFRILYEGIYVPQSGHEICPIIEHNAVY